MQIHLVPGFMFEFDLWSGMLPAFSKLGEVVHVDTTRDASIAESREMHEHIPLSTMILIDHCGHLIPLEQPSLLADSISKSLTPGR
ncbi:alpha/beta fold hydrolase [Sphingopyxis sp. YR583]|uniref:alpha/beta fold hydrolase n=1 Tax=Sphingopyxis sp. YR583 TaxID=1881047 RepID=UPI00115FE68D|nr:alpha/beta hydrolase [Sphingopyxis sp. YR583]